MEKTVQIRLYEFSLVFLKRKRYFLYILYPLLLVFIRKVDIRRPSLKFVHLSYFAA